MNQDHSYSQYFGFTEAEVLSLLRYYSKNLEFGKIKEWYNGYRFGNNTDIYNSWSILNYLANKQLKSCWTNSSSNDLIRTMLLKTDSNFKDIENKKIINESSIWNLLLAILM